LAVINYLGIVIKKLPNDERVGEKYLVLFSFSGIIKKKYQTYFDDL
jgi:hypothetical protein